MSCTPTRNVIPESHQPPVKGSITFKYTGVLPAETFAGCCSAASATNAR
eukprot:CAMPEP_0175457356 /NCGR_PEP_ID=MMETSP0095-20121207/66023_1 /TAXON_ID=311494 /ORGANISM="Alexandrium monilatum, Strain CCMP3105" /LENGTH=48 /DNA_ID= /DNA_START= /DNA_END= /DNA_ORIENTATION=